MNQYLFTRLGLRLLVSLFIILLPSFTVVSQTKVSIILAKLKLTIDHQSLIINLWDTSASRQLLAQLPLTLKFTDFAGSEKITYLPNRLITKGMVNSANTPGDFTYYAPWGNLALFYHGIGNDSQLYTLGQIESGGTILTHLNHDFVAKLELVE